MATSEKLLTFRAPLLKWNLFRCVDVPEKVSTALGGGKRISVRGWIEDLAIQTTLTPRGAGLHRLVVHSRIWRPLELAVGDRVTVALTRDDTPERFPVPEELLAALAEDPDAQRVFQKQTAAMRRQIAGYVAAAKRPESREKRSFQLLERLRNGSLHKT